MTSPWGLMIIQVRDSSKERVLGEMVTRIGRSSTCNQLSLSTQI